MPQVSSLHDQCSSSHSTFFSLTVPHCTIFFLIINLFIYFYFWLCWVFVAVHRLSLVAASGGYSSLQSMGSRCEGSVVVAREL